MKIIISSLMALFVISTGYAQIRQTVHFSNSDSTQNITPKLLFDMYLTSDSHQKITGFPVKVTDADGTTKPVAGIGDRIEAFCFEENQCGLKATVLDIQMGESSESTHVITLKWWNFGWLQAVDSKDLSGPMGSLESIIVLTFKKTKDGSQIELTQVNVPEYKVNIPSPDGSMETGPLSQIVNTHWNTLYWDRFRKYLANNI